MLNTAPRDPAALPRLLITALALLLLWPGLSLSELDLAVLIDGDNTRAMGNFLAGFWPPAHDAEFLALLGRATLETLAIATAGMSLALLIAIITWWLLERTRLGFHIKAVGTNPHAAATAGMRTDRVIGAPSPARSPWRRGSARRPWSDRPSWAP